MFKFLFIIGLALSFIGCGGGTGVTLPAGYTLPPMPDETENSATVTGIDSNSNGVRDDVEIYIYTHYEKVDEQKAMIQQAKSVQSHLADIHSKQDAHIWFDKMTKASDCLDIVFHSSEEGTNQFHILHSATINTIERLRADKNASKMSSGELFEGNGGANPCE